MEQTKNRLQRVINYMKRPDFLLLLGLVNLLLIVSIWSRLHRSTYFDRMGMKGWYDKSYMMNKRGGHDGYNMQQWRGMQPWQWMQQWRGMMNNPQANTEPMPQPEAQPDATQSTWTVQ